MLTNLIVHIIEIISISVSNQVITLYTYIMVYVDYISIKLAEE